MTDQEKQPSLEDEEVQYGELPPPNPSTPTTAEYGDEDIVRQKQEREDSMVANIKAFKDINALRQFIAEESGYEELVEGFGLVQRKLHEIITSKRAKGLPDSISDEVLDNILFGNYNVSKWVKAVDVSGAFATELMELLKREAAISLAALDAEEKQ